MKNHAANRSPDVHKGSSGELRRRAVADPGGAASCCRQYGRDRPGLAGADDVSAYTGNTPAGQPAKLRSKAERKAFRRPAIRTGAAGGPAQAANAAIGKGGGSS